MYKVFILELSESFLAILVNFIFMNRVKEFVSFGFTYRILGPWFR